MARLVVCWPVSWDVVVAVGIGCVESPWMLDWGPAAQTGGGTGLEKSLVGDGFERLRRAIGHRDDRGAAYQQEPESEGENSGWTPIHGAEGFYRAAGCGREGYPIYA